MRVRIDMGKVHGYFEGKFIPDAPDVAVVNDTMTFKEIEQAILNGAKE